MSSLTDAWKAASADAPAGWRVEGLRCSSAGLAPEQRGDRWIAEACGPQGHCIQVEDDDPEHALKRLADKLRLEHRPSRA